MEDNKLYYYILEHISFNYNTLRGEVYLEYEDVDSEGNINKSYRCIESFFLNLNVDKDCFDDVDVEISFGKDSYTHHPANNLKAFKASFKERVGLGDWEEVDRGLYEEFRRNSFRIYQKRMFFDFSSLEKKEK